MIIVYWLLPVIGQAQWTSQNTHPPHSISCIWSGSSAPWIAAQSTGPTKNHMSTIHSPANWAAGCEVGDACRMTLANQNHFNVPGMRQKGFQEYKVLPLWRGGLIENSWKFNYQWRLVLLFSLFSGILVSSFLPDLAVLIGLWKEEGEDTKS